jgi:hypothetical protein
MITPHFQASCPLEVPAIGQFHTLLIEDAASRAEYYLATGAHPAYVWQGFGQELQRMVAMKNWRSAAAFDVLARIHREVIYQYSPETAIRQSLDTFLGVPV